MTKHKIFMHRSQQERLKEVLAEAIELARKEGEIRHIYYRHSQSRGFLTVIWPADGAVPPSSMQWKYHGLARPDGTHFVFDS